MKKKRTLFFLAMLAGAMTLLGLKVRQVNNLEHERFQSALWKLKQLDTEFNQDLLKARFGLLKDYDGFHAIKKEMASTVLTLGIIPGFISPEVIDQIEMERGKCAELLLERDILFERFKSQNSRLANSRRYLPVALEELATRLSGEEKDRELVMLVNEISRSTLIRLASPDEVAYDPKQSLERMKAWAAGNPEHKEARLILSLTRHAQIILAGEKEVDAVTRALLAIPSTVTIERIFAPYDLELAQVLQRARKYRLLLYCLSFVLIASVGYGLWALRAANRTLELRVKERTRELEDTHRQLVDASRRGGMAEIATNVLHNVGNVLNSVNISAGLIQERVEKSKSAGFTKIVAVLRPHANDFEAFVGSDPRGKHLPVYLSQFAEHLLADEGAILSELVSLRRNIEHIKEIVAMQQDYAKFGGVSETVNVRSLVEDGLRMSEDALGRHRVEVIRELDDVPPINCEKHKILQILVNLLRNAKHACLESNRTDKRLTVRMAKEDDRIRISIIDNGIGILPENLSRIFNHGFTTKKEGHGFGLHGGALAASEMGGSLTVRSAGLGAGAAFTLELPYASLVKQA